MDFLRSTVVEEPTEMPSYIANGIVSPDTNLNALEDRESAQGRLRHKYHTSMSTIKARSTTSLEKELAKEINDKR
jgi:hypothetical protein